MITVYYKGFHCTITISIGSIYNYIHNLQNTRAVQQSCECFCMLVKPSGSRDIDVTSGNSPFNLAFFNSQAFNVRSDLIAAAEIIPCLANGLQLSLASYVDGSVLSMLFNFLQVDITAYRKPRRHFPNSKSTQTTGRCPSRGQSTYLPLFIDYFNSSSLWH